MHNIEAIQKLKDLSKKKGKLLIIEDNSIMVETLSQIFGAIFPDMEICILKGEEWPHIEDIIIADNPDIVATDGNLTKWPPHPLYRDFGFNAIPFIKERNSETFVIAMSMVPDNNVIGMEKGADMAVEKGDLMSLKKLIQ